MGVVIVVQRAADLREIVTATHTTRGFASHLNCWQQERDQKADHRNDHQKFEQ